MSLIAGVVKDLVGAVRVLASGAPKVTGTIYVAIRLELDGDASDGRRWCTTHNAWEASPHAFPEATYDAAGDWVYQLPAAATTGKVSSTNPARVRWRMTDNVATPASETATGAEIEETVYSTGAAEAATGAAASVTGAVGSVTGNVGGNLLGTLSVAERLAIADALLDRAAAIAGKTPREAWVAGYLAAAAPSSGMTASGGTAVFTEGGKTLQADLDQYGNRSATSHTL